MAQFVVTHPITIDRPRGTSHPHYTEMIYPLDYGYLENTTSSDDGGIDMWLGLLHTLKDRQRVETLTGILCTFDTLRCDAEIKFLIGCSQADIRIIRNFFKDMYTLYIPNLNPTVDNDLSN